MSKILICIKDDKLRELIKEHLSDVYDLVLIGSFEMYSQIVSNTKIAMLVSDLTSLKVETVDESIKLLVILNRGDNYAGKNCITKPFNKNELLEKMASMLT